MTQKPNKTMSIAVMSGKGGVGKTNLALNLGYSLFRGGHPLLLMDCDLGLANLDVLLGVTPEKTLQDLLDDEAETEEVTVAIDPGGFDFLPAASGVPELVEMDDEMRAQLFAKLSPIFSQYDFLFLDLGAGITQTVLSFGYMAAMRLIIVTPEPTSLTDSYALIKVLSSQFGVTDFHVLVNMAESQAEQKQTFGRLAAACDKFLGIELHYLGGVQHDKAVVESVRRQTPLMRLAPNSKAGKDIFNVALKLKKMRDRSLEQLARQPVLRDFPERG